jgi:hypothetical protein
MRNKATTTACDFAKGAYEGLKKVENKVNEKLGDFGPLNAVHGAAMTVFHAVAPSVYQGVALSVAAVNLIEPVNHVCLDGTVMRAIAIDYTMQALYSAAQLSFFEAAGNLAAAGSMLYLAKVSGDIIAKPAGSKSEKMT